MLRRAPYLSAQPSRLLSYHCCNRLTRRSSDHAETSPASAFKNGVPPVRYRKFVVVPVKHARDVQDLNLTSVLQICVSWFLPLELCTSIIGVRSESPIRAELGVPASFSADKFHPALVRVVIECLNLSSITSTNLGGSEQDQTRGVHINEFPSGRIRGASQGCINEREQGRSAALTPQSLMAAAITLVLSVLLAFVLWKTAKRLLRPTFPLPPGPRGWPIIGNLFQIPKDFEHETYHAWARECGTFIVFPVLLDGDSTLNYKFWH
jgi:hypothetical protein